LLQQPVSASLQPVSASLQPVSASLQPVSASLQPVSASLQPVSASLQPVSASLQQDSAALPPRYDSPEAIYQRYVAARSAWYAAQPRGSIKTNQQYRKANGLPLRYNKKSYDWCLDYKQMGKRCTTAPGSREWTKEEMMAYLDWSKAEDERIEAQVVAEIGDNPFGSNRRGMDDIWRRAERDAEEQEALYLAERQEESCIIIS
jgi:hypothetical protein